MPIPSLSDRGPACNTRDTLPVLTVTVPGGEATPTFREMTQTFLQEQKGTPEEKPQGHFPGPRGKENTSSLQPPPAGQFPPVQFWGADLREDTK